MKVTGVTPAAFSTGGYTLIEVLVTMVVVSIGLLGLASLQVSSLRSNNQAFQSSQATLLANDIVDRIRANRDANNAPRPEYAVAMGDAVAQDADCQAVECTPAQMVTFDLWQWKQSMGELPGGDGSIVVTPATGVITVTLQWTEGDTVRQFQLNTQP